MYHDEDSQMCISSQDLSLNTRFMYQTAYLTSSPIQGWRHLKHSKIPDLLFQISSTCLVLISRNSLLILSIPWVKIFEVILDSSLLTAHSQSAKLMDFLFGTWPRSDHFLPPHHFHCGSKPPSFCV